jgi:hypothetical protein
MRLLLLLLCATAWFMLGVGVGLSWAEGAFTQRRALQLIIAAALSFVAVEGVLAW